MEPLAGSMGNGGNVFRSGDRVLRPPGPHTRTLTMLLNELAAVDFPAPLPLGRTASGQEAFGWIDGDVAVPPFPDWSMSDEALASAARLLRRYHDAAATLELPLSDLQFSQALADPLGGPIICHNDVCPENVVYRDGQAHALLDFDFAAPGRPLWDVAQMARMWAPLRPVDVRVAGMTELDPFRRLAVLADAYGVAAEDRGALVHLIYQSAIVGRAFVMHRVELGEPAFVTAWEARGGKAAADRMQAWLEEQYDNIVAALGAA